MLFDDVQIAQVIVDRDASVVDEDVEGVDRLDRRWICDALVTSSLSAVTRSSAISIGPRLPANTLFAPRRMASLTSARPMPRFAPVIRTVLFAMSIPLWLRRVMDEISFHPFLRASSRKGYVRRINPLRDNALEVRGRADEVEPRRLASEAVRDTSVHRG